MRLGVRLAVAALVVSTGACRQTSAPLAAPAPFELLEADIPSMQAALTNGSLSSRGLCEMYLKRIADLNPRLHAIIETNPDALAIADQLDEERAKGRVRGPLHGVPVMVKDIIETKDRMETAAGSLALVGVPVQDDAVVVQKLREAGAVILGKTNLTEWGGAGERLGWSSRGGQTVNPYAANKSPLGSSAGSAAAVTANLAAASLGGETVGSIVGPASVMGVVGLKATAGLVSRRGTVPVARAIDAIGPIARTVRETAMMLSAMASTDDRDPQSIAPDRPAPTDYTALLSLDGLRGIRLGVVREPALGAEAQPLFDRAVADLQALGATVVDAAVASDFDSPRAGIAFETWFFRQFADSLAWYFTTRPNDRVRGSDDIMAANRRLATDQRPIAWMGQSTFELMHRRNRAPARTRQRNLAWLTKLEAENGLDAMLAKYHVDGFVSRVGPTGPVEGPPPPLSNMILLASLAGGAPVISVPMGQVNDVPVGLLFVTKRWGDERLLRWAYAYEQHTHHRRPPTSTLQQ